MSFSQLSHENRPFKHVAVAFTFYTASEFSDFKEYLQQDKNTGIYMKVLNCLCWAYKKYLVCDFSIFFVWFIYVFVYLSLTRNNMWNGGDVEFLFWTLDPTFHILHLHHNGLQLKIGKKEKRIPYFAVHKSAAHYIQFVMLKVIVCKIPNWLFIPVLLYKVDII